MVDTAFNHLRQDETCLVSTMDVVGVYFHVKSNALRRRTSIDQDRVVALLKYIEAILAAPSDG
jgi:hypothetical protein